jgi:hypothetical protein
MRPFHFSPTWRFTVILVKTHVTVPWRFRASAARGDLEKRTARVARALLFALAAYVAIIWVAGLLGDSEPKPTLPGIAILIAAAVVLPGLATKKRRLSGATGSAALRAHAARSALCAYLSLIASVGLSISGNLSHSVGQTRLRLESFCRSWSAGVGKPCAGRRVIVANKVRPTP